MPAESTNTLFAHLESEYGITRSSEEILDMEMLAWRLDIVIHEISMSKLSRGYHANMDGQDHIFLNLSLEKAEKTRVFYHEVGHVLDERIKAKEEGNTPNFLRVFSLESMGVTPPIPEEMEIAVKERCPSVDPRTLKKLSRKTKRIWSAATHLGVFIGDLTADMFADDMMRLLNEAEMRNGGAEVERRFDDGRFEHFTDILSKARGLGSKSLEGGCAFIDFLELLRLTGLRDALGSFGLMRERVRYQANTLLRYFLKLSIRVLSFFVLRLAKRVRPFFLKHSMEQELLELFATLSSGKFREKECSDMHSESAV